MPSSNSDSKTLIIEAHAKNGGPSPAPFAIVQISQKFLAMILQRGQALTAQRNSLSVVDFCDPVTVSASFNAPNEVVHFPLAKANSGYWVVSSSRDGETLRFECCECDQETTGIYLDELATLYASIEDKCVGVYARADCLDKLKDDMGFAVGSYSNEEFLKNHAAGGMPEHYLAYMHLGQIACHKALVQAQSTADALDLQSHP